MSTSNTPQDLANPPSEVRKRPPPGERRLQILQTLASMLQTPGGERVTTAALAGQVGVSEAALYRHFASKAQMFEGLLDFIEQSVFTLVQRLQEREPDGRARSRKLVALVLQFGEKNPGMARVMVGDALVLEDERLQQRMALFFDKLEASLRQNLRDEEHLGPNPQAQVQASVLISFCVGRLQRYTRSGFKRPPTEHLQAALLQVLP